MTNGRCGPGTLLSSPPRPPRSQVAALLGATLTTSMSNLAQTTVLGLLVYELTGSELALGFLGLAEFAPAALLVVVAGSVVDRFDRVHVAALGALSNAVVALAMAWYVRDSARHVDHPDISLGHRLRDGTGVPVSGDSFHTAGDGPQCRRAVARRPPLIASEAATILGPILGGLLYLAGVWVALVAVAGLSLIGAAAILAIRTANEERLRTSELSPVGDDEVGHVLEEGIPASRGGLHEALEGLRFVRATPVLLGAISLDLFAVLFGGAVTLLPAIAVRLQVGPVALGWLRASVGLGAGVTTLAISFRPIERRVGRVLLIAVAVFGAWTIVLGLARSYWLAFVAMFSLSAADAVSVFIRSTLVPLATPPVMRGRVLAVENVFIGASNELGGFESGAIGQLLGTTGSVVLGGIATLVVAVVWGILFSPLRRVDRFPTPPSAAASGEDGRAGSRD